MFGLADSVRCWFWDPSDRPWCSTFGSDNDKREGMGVTASITPGDGRFSVSRSTKQQGGMAVSTGRHLIALGA